MKRENGIIYYSVKECAYLVGVTQQTFYNWIYIDNEMKNQGKEGFLPNFTIIGNKRYYQDSEAKKIKRRIAKLKRGDFLAYRKNETTYNKLKKEIEGLKMKIEVGVSNENR